MREVKFFVAGVPVPQGSKKMIPNRHTRKMIMIDDNPDGLTAWRRAVRDAAKANRNTWLLQSPLHVGLRFTMPRRGHAEGEWSATAPDLDKLIRAVFDALKQGGCLVDDAQVVKVTASKVRGDETGVYVIVRDVA